MTKEPGASPSAGQRGDSSGNIQKDPDRENSFFFFFFPSSLFLSSVLSIIFLILPEQKQLIGRGG